MTALSITGFSGSDPDVDTLRASIHAGFTGLTGLSVSLAHVRVKNSLTSVIRKKIDSLSCVCSNHVNPVKPVKHQYSCGFQRISVVSFRCKTLLIQRGEW